ncbi:MBOAT family O-acyltransferase [Costertonia aggregata]|nr:MBOAT family O-acyltransferase [Costertonia aggregata]
MSYTIDVYRKKIVPEMHLGKFALFVSFFPQLVAGPIERANRLLPQFYEKVKFNVKNIKRGLIFMAWGFFLKVVVADRLGIYVDEAFLNPADHSGIPLALGGFFFGFQIYYDFSAYTAIAIGSAKVLGIDLMQNFNRPFFSTSANEFWKKWHISLMQWMRDYIYLPLRRNLKMSRLTSVFIVFFINGLWHGANWTFIIWSLLNGLFLVVEIATLPLRNKIFMILKVPNVVVSFLGWVMTIGYLIFTLIFFRASSLGHAFLYIKNVFRVRALNPNIIDNYLEVFISIGFIVLVQLIHYFKGNRKIYELVENKHFLTRWALYSAYILITVLFAINRQNNFIYFQF